MKPNFLVIGAAKSATTSLCHYLSQHPDVFMSEPKEPNFFAADHNYQKGWDWYLAHFRGAKDERAIGEGTVKYSICNVFPHTIKRIAKDMPDARLIYMVRHPLIRMESHWLQKRHNGQCDPKLSFQQALRDIPDLIDASCYWTQINGYRNYFPDEQILVLFFEQFKTDPYGVLDKCFNFLGIDPSIKPDNATRPVNVTKDHLEDLPILWMIRKFPKVMKYASGLSTKGLRQLIKRIMRRPIDTTVNWDPDTWQRARQQVEDNVRTFLSFYGKPVDFWSWQMPQQHRKR